MSKKHEQLKFDQIGYWSELKLDIIREYSKHYSNIISKQTHVKLKHCYIDAFAGAGLHIKKSTGEIVDGSPVIAAETKPPFYELHLIDLDGSRTEHLQSLFVTDERIAVYQGDCNEILIRDVFPKMKCEDYRRALCLLDPYGLHLNWDVMKAAADMRTIEIFLNFPVADMNRNVLWQNPEGVDPADIARMNAFWGDDTWKTVAYKQQKTLFDTVEIKTDNETIAEAFRQRLIDVAGFAYVPSPIPMTNSKGAIVYYLYFAAQKDVSHRIVSHIFKNYRHRGKP